MQGKTRIQYFCVIFTILTMLQLAGCDKKTEETIPPESASSETESVTTETPKPKSWTDAATLAQMRAFRLDMSKEYYISQAYPVLETSGESATTTMYFVFSEEKCVGELLIYEPTQTGTFFQSNRGSVTFLYESEIGIALLSPDPSQIYAVRDDGGRRISIYGREGPLETDLDLPYSPITLRPLSTP